MREKIIRLREAKHMSQSDLARALKISRAAVNNWEQGLGEPCRDLLIPLARVLGTTADYLLDDQAA
jgi:transcriptional regulator with XRE-family HTH domain